MRHRLSTRTRALLYVGGALALLACAAIYAVPGQSPAAQTAATQATPAVPNVNGLMTFPNVRVVNAPAPADQSATAQGQRAFIDPATGQLREPTPEEAAALARVTTLRTTPAVTAKDAAGNDMVVLGSANTVFAVANADAAGTVSMGEATGPEAAATKMNTKAPATGGKGAANDR